jgi:GGDEF domain-containing protein
MSLQGSFLVVAEKPASGLRDAILAAGAFPVVEARTKDAAVAIATVNPAAIVIDDGALFDGDVARVIEQRLSAVDAPLVPVIARLVSGGALPLRDALPVSAEAPLDRVVARMSYALRVRGLHATVMRRMRIAEADGGPMPALASADPLDDATVLVAGRGRSYPALAVAVGERAGLIGALSIETAARYLADREIEGVVVGDGFAPRVVEALLTIIAEDARFRDLPVAVLGGCPSALDHELPNFERVDGDADELVNRFLPLVRLHALEARLKRMLNALDANGMLDPATGLLTGEAFGRNLASAVNESNEYGCGLCIARFSFSRPWAGRSIRDAARLVSRLVRSADFACQDDDHSILVAFTGTDLRAAHVIARRIASVVKHTAVTPDHEPARIAPAVTLAALKPSDTAASLLARVDDRMAVAAG